MQKQKKQLKPAKLPNPYRELCWIGCDARTCVCHQECHKMNDGTPVLYRAVAKMMMGTLRRFPLKKDEKLTPFVQSWYTTTYERSPTLGQVYGIMSAHGNLLSSAVAHKRKKIRAKLAQPSLFEVA